MHTNTQKAIQTYHLHITCRDPQAGAQFLELQFQDTGRSKPPAGAIKQIKESCQAETHAQNNMQSVHWTYIAFLFQTTSHIVANIPRSQEDLKPIISLQSTSELNINPLCRIPRKHRWALASDCVQKTIEVHAAWILLAEEIQYFLKPTRLARCTQHMKLTHLNTITVANSSIDQCCCLIMKWVFSVW